MIKYHVSGNAGCWQPNPKSPVVNPSNWWDNIGFGHQDAYANALAYRALRGMDEFARRLGKTGDARRWQAAARKLHDAYFKAFYNPATGILAGWRRPTASFSRLLVPLGPTSQPFTTAWCRKTRPKPSWTG